MATAVLPRAPGAEDRITIATQLQSLPSGKLSEIQRKKLLEHIPIVSEHDVILRDESRGFSDGVHASLRTTGEKVMLTKMSLKSWDAPKLISIYATLSGSVGIQKLFGVFHSNNSLSFAVMEDLEESPFCTSSRCISSGLWCIFYPEIANLL